MNLKKYQSLLSNNLLPIGNKIGTGTWVYQQGNAPIHRSVTTMNWFKLRNFNVLDWLSRSSDLSPIGNLWRLFVHKVYKNARQFETTTDLKVVITNSWEQITEEDRKSLIDSMEQRIFDTIKNNQ